MPTGRKILTFALALLVLTGAVGGASRAAAEDGARHPLPRIVNGVLTSEYASTGVLLNGDNFDNAGLLCTGVLIGCETFLTAGHCVVDSGEAPAGPENFSVFFQHAGFFRVASVELHPDYAFPEADLAVLKLAVPVTGIAPTPINTVEVPATGTDGIIVGFGRTGGNSFEVGLKYAGTVVTATCGDGISNTTSVCWSFVGPLGDPGQSSNTCNGDSGGPLFVDFGAGLTVAGVTSGGTSDNCRPPDHAFDANVFFYRDWIRAVGGSDVDNASCGDGPQVGQSGATVVAMSGKVSSSKPEDRYTISVPPAVDALRVTMNGVETGLTDFDLYVKAGSVPTLTDYDCRGNGFGQYAACEFAAPVPGDWHLMVQQASGSGVHQLTATYFGVDCNDAANEGASCDDGNQCTDADRCVGGTCRGATLADGVSCDDGDLCTALDTCQAGACMGAPICADHFVAYDVAASRIGDNVLPSGWNLTLDDALLDNESADDPENYQVLREKGLLLPAARGDGPLTPGPLHYLRYGLKESREGIGEPTGARFPRAVKHVPRLWSLVNGFGTGAVESTRVKALLVPAALGLTLAPEPVGDADHFICYQVDASSEVITQQSPESRPGSGVARFRNDLQSFFTDSFADCTTDVFGQVPFAGTPVEGRCLYDLMRPRELCVPAATSAVEGERKTSAMISDSQPSLTTALLCYQARLASRFKDGTAADLAGATLGDRLAGKLRHAPRRLKNGTQVFVGPENGFDAPTQADTRRAGMLCVPSLVVDVNPH
jgi:hypothetical protein